MATNEHTETTVSTRLQIGRNSGGNVSFDGIADLRQFMADTSEQLAGLTMLLTSIGDRPEDGVKELRDVVQDMTWQMQQAVELLFTTEQTTS